MGFALVPMIYGTLPGGILVSFMGSGRWPARVFLPIECPINHVDFPSKGFVSASMVAAPPKVVISGENLGRSNMKIKTSLLLIEDIFYRWLNYVVIIIWITILRGVVLYLFKSNFYVEIENFQKCPIKIINNIGFDISVFTYI